MSLGDPYCTLEQFKAYILSSNQQAQSTFTSDDTLMTACIAAASSKIERHCQRQFNLSNTETVRLFAPSDDPKIVEVDDFVLTEGFNLLTDPSGVGDFVVTWTAFDYELHPLNNLVNGIYFPYNEIRAVSGSWFWRPILRREGTVQVTALWGWQEVPDEVSQATLLIAAELYKMKDMPFGISGLSTFGQIRVKDNPIACELLAPFVVNPLMIG